MGFHTQTHFAQEDDGEIWDPYTVLQINNPDRNAFTCVGHARTQGRRCRNLINQNNRALVYDILDRISFFSPDSREVSKALPRLASLSLCLRWHQPDAASIASKWAMRVSSLAEPRYQERKIKSENARSWESDGDHARGFSKHHQQHRGWEWYEDDMPKHNQAKQEERREEDVRERERQEEARRRKRREDEQERRHEQKWQEKQDREQEAKEQKRQEDERERRREQERREKQDQEQKAKEQAVRDWQQAWNSYVSKWRTFREANREPSTVEEARQLIPWPTKSSHFDDVTQSRVEEFFRKACPEAGTSNMNRTMRIESLKWHPDKSRHLYRSCEMDDVDK